MKLLILFFSPVLLVAAVAAVRGQQELGFGDLADMLGNLDHRLQQLETISKQNSLESALLGSEQHTIPRTCYELHKRQPSLPSGEYLIDPDGSGTGDAPFQVFCDMESGTTTVSHDTEDPTQITPCFVPGCYSRSINYRTTQRQLTALTRFSTECRQLVQFDCIKSALSYNGITVSWWEDRDGNSNYYWAGSNTTGHTCQCGLDGNCIKPSIKCNCDAKAAEQQTDKGYITEKAALPVMALHYGIVQDGKHTLGKLECSGQLKVNGMPSSCADLWTLGHVSSGLYNVKAASGLQLVYCDMDKEPGKEGFETIVGKPDVKTKPIYFHATGLVGYNNITRSLIFRNTLLNIGDGLNPVNGVFTVPISGVYSFSFLCRAMNVDNVELLVDNTVVAATDHDSQENISISLTATLKLNAGQKVTLSPKGQVTFSIHVPYTVFTGALLEEY